MSVNNIKKRKFPIKTLVASALLAAISIVCGKYLAINAGEVLRFSFENLPVILAGVAFGPIAGLAVGVVADLVGCLLVGFTINPLVTVGAGLIGFSSGLIYTLLSKTAMTYTPKLVISVAVAHVLGSVLVKTLGLAAYYSMPLGILMLWRLLNYAIIGVVEGVILWFLMKNKQILHYVNLLKS